MVRYTSPIDSYLDGISLRTRLARASELASVGAYSLAEEALCFGAHEMQTPEEYDLLARIRFYQGRNDSARLLWTTAQRIGGVSDLYSKELHFLDEYEELKKRIKRLAFRFFYLLLAVLVLTLIGGLVWKRYTISKGNTKPASQDTTTAPTALPAISPAPGFTPSPSPAQKSYSSTSKDHKKDKKGPVKNDPE